MSYEQAREAVKRGMKRAPGKKKGKFELTDRSRTLLERIRSRREEIRERMGILSDSAALIREERDSRF
jgi:molybdenum-dependent DNA-binding transcriptional regulator ModE